MAVGPQFMVVSIFVLDTSCITNGGFNKGLTLRPNFPFANKLKTQCPLATCLGTWIWTSGVHNGKLCRDRSFDAFGHPQWKKIVRDEKQVMKNVEHVYVSMCEKKQTKWIRAASLLKPFWFARNETSFAWFHLHTPGVSWFKRFWVFFALFLQKTSPCIPPTPTKKVWTSGRWGLVEARDEITQNLRKIGLWLWFLNDYRCKSHIFLIFSDWICLNSCQVWSPAMIWGCVNMVDHTGPWQLCTSEVLLLAGSRPFRRLGGWVGGFA